MAENIEKLTFENVWKSIKELRDTQEQAQKETHLQFKETDRRIERVTLELKQAQKETDRQLKETSKEVAKTVESIAKTNGSFNTKWGEFLENLVEGDLIRLLNKCGVQVSLILPRVKYVRPDNSIGAEYDLIAINGSEVVVFEIKTTLGVKDVYGFIERLKKVKDHFPKYSDKKIYGGMAYMKADGDSSKEADEKGLFLIKAPGGANQVSTLTNSDNFVPESF